MDDPGSQVILLLILLLASAFFSGMEIAFISANRLKIELDKAQGKRGKPITRSEGVHRLLSNALLDGEE